VFELSEDSIYNFFSLGQTKKYPCFRFVSDENIRMGFFSPNFFIKIVVYYIEVEIVYLL